MKRAFLILALPLLPAAPLAAAPLAAAPLQQPTPAYAAPQADATVLTTLPAGSEPAEATSAKAIPAGWRAVQLAGPQTVYVHEHDVLKNFDVKPGASYRAAPDEKSEAIAIATDSDQVEITGLSGRWLQLALKAPVTAYIRANTPAAEKLPGETHTAETASSPAATASAITPEKAPAATASAHQTTQAPATVATGQAVSTPGTAGLPRFYAGVLASTRSPFRPRRPYDYQLNDSDGGRIAYIDTSKLLITRHIDDYLNLPIKIYGTASDLPNSKEVVIKAESIQLP